MKLRVAWDKRIVLSRCSKLKRYGKRGIFITADESMEVRRKSTFERLKFRAHQAGQHVMVTDGILIIDGVQVFSVENGYLRYTNG